MLLWSFKFGCHFILLLYGRKSLQRQYYSRKKFVSQTPKNPRLYFQILIHYVLFSNVILIRVTPHFARSLKMVVRVLVQGYGF
mmetsp:Transcript_4561/g.6953  ORF Transcript_4561/g.6953 Transcript_4561/m.6953 type:complete len:83 (+) Transcript_4561:103-351(+)